jgi:hypothetical protein
MSASQTSAAAAAAAAARKAQQQQQQQLPPRLTVDMLARVLQTSVFHPFIAWLVPLCQRAVATPYASPAMRASVAYALAVSACWLLAALNRRIAYGAPRPVRLEHEVIVVTGGASGLGLLIAEVYGVRGASVAVLDVAASASDADAAGNLQSRGVAFYQCDVGDRAQIQRVAQQIEQDVNKIDPKLSLSLAGLFFAFSFPLRCFGMREVDESTRTPCLLVVVIDVCIYHSDRYAHNSNKRCGNSQWKAAAGALGRGS